MENIEFDKADPEYYYQVSIFITTFRMDKNKTEPFSHSEIFKDSNLLAAKKEATKFYEAVLQGRIEKGGFEFMKDQEKIFLSYESRENFIFGENAAFSVTLSLIEKYPYPVNEIYEHPIMGEDEETINESIEIETEILNQYSSQ